MMMGYNVPAVGFVFDAVGQPKPPTRPVCDIKNVCTLGYLLREISKKDGSENIIFSLDHKPYDLDSSVVGQNGLTTDVLMQNIERSLEGENLEICQRYVETPDGNTHIQSARPYITVFDPNGVSADPTQFKGRCVSYSQDGQRLFTPHDPMSATGIAPDKVPTKHPFVMIATPSMTLRPNGSKTLNWYLNDVDHIDLEGQGTQILQNYFIRQKPVVAGSACKM